MKIIDFETAKRRIFPDDFPSTDDLHNTEDAPDEIDCDIPIFERRATSGNGRPNMLIQKYRGQVMEREAFIKMMQAYFNRKR